MIGNDVIDIIQSRHESNWQRKGFLEKLFTSEEQLLISHHQKPELMVWLLWSMKEAAYKIYNRQTKIRAFIPKKLVCTIDLQNSDCATGKVYCGENVYYTKTSFINDSIHTIAVCHLKDLDNIIQIEKKDISKDQYGIPYLAIPHSNTFQDVSISNHGRYEKVVCISDSNQ